jgi:hypothetical protein
MHPKLRTKLAWIGLALATIGLFILAMVNWKIAIGVFLLGVADKINNRLKYGD